jgi:hypothetical protein
MDLNDLGFTKEELQDRVVNQLCESLLVSTFYDEDDQESGKAESHFMQKLKAVVLKRIDKTIEEMAAKHVLPNVSKYIEGFCLQETTAWGEKKGSPMSFTEYLVKRAEHYMNEKVNYKGESQSEDRYGSWSGTQTRITHLVNEHLHYSIKSAMEDALKVTNGAIATGIAETVKLKLEEIVKGLQVQVAVKR